MRWRVLLEGHQFDLDVLAQLFTHGELVVSTDDDGYHYVTGDEINAATTAEDALQRATRQLPLLNGIGRGTDPTYHRVSLAGTVVNEGQPQDRYVFAECKMESRSRLTVGGQSAAVATPLMSKAAADPALMEAITRLGASPNASWIDLYKIFEVLKDAAGGQAALQQRAGVTKTELSRFTLTANHPEGSGDLARHARLGQQPPANPMSLEEGQGFVRHLITHW